jgi:hypothetical protein
MKTGMQKVLGRQSYEVRPFYNRTGKRDKDGKVIFEVLTLLDFTSKHQTSKAKN